MRTTLLAGLAAPLALGLAYFAEELAFHPGKDARSKKSLAIEGEFQVRDLSFTVNGEPMPGEMLEQVTASSMLVNLAVDVTEVFRQTKDGRPIELLRTYDDLQASFEFGEDSQEVDDASGIEGKTVRFAWNEKDQAYDKDFHESTGDEQVIADLIDDMEVRALLPKKKVAPGDTWELAVADLEPLFFPGGYVNLDQDAEDGPEVDAIAEDFGSQIEEALKDFKVQCTFKGVRDEDGTRVGEIAFRYDGRCDLDLDQVLTKIKDAVGEGQDMPEMEISASAGMTLKGEGSALWDIEAGMLHTYTMQADLELAIKVDVRGDADGESFELALSGALGGTVTWDMARED